jgi:hypothetical protein
LRAAARRDALFFLAFPLRFAAPTFAPTARLTFFTSVFTLRVIPPRFAAAFRLRDAIGAPVEGEVRARVRQPSGRESSEIRVPSAK